MYPLMSKETFIIDICEYYWIANDSMQHKSRGVSTVDRALSSSIRFPSKLMAVQKRKGLSACV